MRSSALLFFLLPTITFCQLSNLNDEFDRPCSLNEWQNITEYEGWEPAEHLEEWDVSSTYPGSLMMMPYTSTWFQDYRGTLIFKEITGDFVFTTQVTALNRAGQNTPPNSSFSLAGVMLRESSDRTNGFTDWAEDQENYIFLSIGRADSNQWQFEVKNTINGSSNLAISNITSNDANIRMVRIGGAILVLHEIDGAGWVLHRRYSRNDFPADMQIGFVTYTDWPSASAYAPSVQNNNVLNNDFENRSWSPDLIGVFDFARWNPVNVPPELVGSDFSDSMEVDRQTIIDLYGYDSTPASISNARIWQGIQNSDWGESGNWLDGNIPSAMDNVIIPSCDCAAVQVPSLSIGTPTFASFELEEGASLLVPVGAVLSVDLTDVNSYFVNAGMIEVYGTIQIDNAIGKSIENTESIVIRSGGQLIINE